MISMELVHLILSSMLVSLIWLIQILHYPSFKFVDKMSFSEFHKFHTQRISYLVIPLMLGEFITGLWLMMSQLDQEIKYDQWNYVWNFLSILFIWLATLTLSIPEHHKLSKTKNDKSIQKLVTTNWVRTIVWSWKLVGLTWSFGNA